MLNQILITIRKLYIIFIVLFISLNLFGASYYVNDDNTIGDRYCTAVGNDTNDGKTPATPKRTITNLLSTYNLGPGDIVYIDAGIYNERVVITSDDGGDSTGYVTFKGVASGGTNAVINGTGAGWNEECISLDNVNYIKLDSFYIHYSGGNHVYGIFAKNNCTNLLIVNNKCISNTGSGIRIEQTYYSVISNNLCSYNDRIGWDWPSGIILNNAYSNRIIKNDFVRNGTNAGNGNGIRIENASFYNTVISNNCSFNMRIGIEIANQGSQSKYNTLIGNTCEGNTNEGMLISHPYNIITNNKIYNNNKGIVVDWGGNNAYIAGNEIYNNSSDGIALYRYRNTVTNNIIHNNSGKGIDMNYEASNNYILDNQIYNCSHGIGFGSANNGNPMIGNLISKNEIHNNTWDGIVGEGGDYNTIISNNIHHNSAAGISLHGNTNSYNIIRENKIWGNGSAGININGDGNILRYNIVYSNGCWGIRIDGKNGAPFTNEFNVIYDNTWEGIMIDNAGSGSLVKNCTLFRNGADGIDLNKGSLLVKNCISVSNSEQGYNQSAGTMTVNYCDAYGNNLGAYDSATTNNCLTADPKFESTNPSDTNFLHLSGGSPCINAGDPTDTVPSGGGTRIDMGAYEYPVLKLPPQITSISTNKIGRGNELTIIGLNFQDNQYFSTVAFSNTTDGLVPVSEYNLWNDTTIKVTVPSGLSVDTTNSIKVTTWGGTDITNKAVVIIDAYADIIKTGPKAPSVTPTKGKTTTSFTLSVYYRDADGDSPASNYPKCVTTTNGVPAFTNIMSTNVSSGSWTNRLCQTVFTIPFEHSNISNFFILKAATGNTNEYITGSFKLISRVDDTVLPATKLSKSTTETSITIKWNIQEPYIVSQTIYWNTSSPATAGSSVTLSASATSYKIENLTPGTEYYIIVRTYDDLGNYADTIELKVITSGVRPPSDKLAVRNNFIRPEHPIAYIYVNNPANPQANIIIKVYTIYGKLVKELVNAPLENINQPIIWDGTDSKGNKVPSGVYIIYGEGYKYNEKKRVYVVR